MAGILGKDVDLFRETFLKLNIPLDLFSAINVKNLSG